MGPEAKMILDLRRDGERSRIYCNPLQCPLCIHVQRETVVVADGSATGPIEGCCAAAFLQLIRVLRSSLCVGQAGSCDGRWNHNQYGEGRSCCLGR